MADDGANDLADAGADNLSPDTAGLAVLPALPQADQDKQEAELLRLVLDSVTSVHSRRSYAKGLRQFFMWCRGQRQPAFEGFSQRLPNLAVEAEPRAADDQSAPVAGPQAGSRDG